VRAVVCPLAGTFALRVIQEQCGSGTGVEDLGIFNDVVIDRVLPVNLLDPLRFCGKTRIVKTGEIVRLQTGRCRLIFMLQRLPNFTRRPSPSADILFPAGDGSNSS
jgi:hypothetical protein